MADTCWLRTVVLMLLSAPAFAQCGPNAAPAHAAAQGYTCETFRWGSGDTDLGNVDEMPLPCLANALVNDIIMQLVAVNTSSGQWLPAGLVRQRDLCGAGHHANRRDISPSLL